MRQLHKKLGVYSLKLEELVKQRTAQLEQTQAKLVKSERLAAIGELAGMVGHDLRNPLTSIKGATYYLKTKYSPELDQTGKEMLSTIERGIDYSNKIINDLLDYSRELTLELTCSNPKLLVKNSLDLISIPKNITVRNLAAEQDLVMVDQSKMTRVILYMAKNAFDAMPNGGTLTITSSKANGNWELLFADTGEGMSLETLGKLWVPLFTTKAKGMGFGLAICRRIVEAHGGKISVNSTVGQGTAFLISLPVDTTSVAQQNGNDLGAAAALKADKNKPA
jgi:signal transduction histidine kinase